MGRLNGEAEFMAIDSHQEYWWEHEIGARERIAAELGGEERVKRQHDAGRYTARERIEKLFDTHCWDEIGKMAGRAQYGEDGRIVGGSPSNVVGGIGEIDERETVVLAEDFTVRGGSSEASSPEKWQYIERLALEYRMPLVRLVETAGGSINLLKQAGATKIPGYARWPTVNLMETVPVVGVAMGAAAGLGAVRVVASHFSVMIAGGSYVFAGGPDVVKPGVGEAVDKEALGGSAVHARGSGVVDNEAEDEDDALQQVRQFLSYLPTSVHHIPSRKKVDDTRDDNDESLASIVPENKRRAYDMRSILKRVLDEGSIFEIGKYNGRSLITVLATLDGYPVAVMANDPKHLGGALTADAAEKMTRFVDTADTFNLPIINFVDQPGTYVGQAAERAGTLRRGIRAQMAIGQTVVPWATVFIRRAFGLAGGATSPHNRHVDWRIAWPSAYWGSIPIEGGVEAAYKRELAASENPEKLRAELLEEFRPFENPFLTAEKFGINDIIDPRTTRYHLRKWVRQAYRILPECVGPKSRGMRC